MTACLLHNELASYSYIARLICLAEKPQRKQV
jgi:hypothetical protein